MRVFTAPEEVTLSKYDVTCFLAGGIQNCPNWQRDVIDILKSIAGLNDLVVFNPRRDNFPIHDPNAAQEQIQWEFNHLQTMDIFTMFFCDGPSDQPICMYELGRNLVRMQDRFPDDFVNRTVITCDQNYRRKQDVEIQTGLAIGQKDLPSLVYLGDDYKDLIAHHAFNIKFAYQLVKEKM